MTVERRWVMRKSLTLVLGLVHALLLDGLLGWLVLLHHLEGLRLLVALILHKLLLVQRPGRLQALARGRQFQARASWPLKLSPLDVSRWTLVLLLQ